MFAIVRTNGPGLLGGVGGSGFGSGSGAGGTYSPDEPSVSMEHGGYFSAHPTTSR